MICDRDTQLEQKIGLAFSLLYREHRGQPFVAVGLLLAFRILWWLMLGCNFVSRRRPETGARLVYVAGVQRSHTLPFLPSTRLIFFWSDVLT